MPLKGLMMTEAYKFTHTEDILLLFAEDKVLILDDRRTIPSLSC